MIFHYAGKYNGDENSLPRREHPENSVPFKEAEDMKKLAIIANIGAIGVMFLLAIPFGILGRKYFMTNSIGLGIGSICSMLSLLPHEILHALCFKDDVFFYSNLKQGILFVVGTEDMSKGHFIFMSLLPNIVFGLLPYLVFLISPNHLGFGMFGIICIGMGFGDYINVYNAIVQVPKGALTYLSGMHSFWYMPNSKNK